MLVEQELAEVLKEGRVLIDVRSPGEYHQGHIPCAVNMPVFDDDERAVVGTLYKQTSFDAAFKEALKIFGPKLGDLVDTATSFSRKKEVAVYCWRGGMRSQAIAWLLHMAGFDVVILTGGYKVFRRWALDQLEVSRRLFVLGGRTGAAKTWILNSMRKMGEQVLDFEALASHRGSSYGGLGLPEQPTQEHFENKISYLLHYFDDRPIWVEHESRLIGHRMIPAKLFEQLGQAPLVVINRPKQERVAHLWSQYGHYSSEELSKATIRLTKKLGSERTREALDDLEAGNIYGMIEKVLAYYDKTYDYALTTRKGQILELTHEGFTQAQWADLILQQSTELDQVPTST